MDPLKLNPRPSITDLRPVLQRIADTGYDHWGAQYCCLFSVMRHPESLDAVGHSRDYAVGANHEACIEACDMLAKMTHTQRAKAIDVLAQMGREQSKETTQPDTARE